MKITKKILTNTIVGLALTSNIVNLPILAATVSPVGVNVRSFAPTTVFLTFLGLNNQVPAEGLWCGAINANNSCVPGTIFGRLPRRYNLSRLSGTNNYTDIMTIPSSIARRAYQDALQGNNADFFYVRRFISTTGGPDEFVAVTCRLSSGGARTPLSLTGVRLQLANNQPISVVSSGESIPRFGANITYNGTGRLKGRWEVVLPGDSPPSQRDLLTEATLPLEERGLQRRYTQLQRFDLFLQPTGQVFLPGPDPDKLPRGLTGLHQILLRIEATDDREGNSDILSSTVNSGGVAGFPMPVFRYFITTNSEKLTLLEPSANSQLLPGQPIRFAWQGIEGAGGYKLEVKDREKIILSAVLSPDRRNYNAPPWLKISPQTSLNWRIQALKKDGSILAESESQKFQILSK
jgi:hypothetical protein